MNDYQIAIPGHRPPYINHSARTSHLVQKLHNMSADPTLLSAISDVCMSKIYELKEQFLQGMKVIPNNNSHPQLEDIISEISKELLRSETMEKMRIMRTSFLEKEEYEKRVQLLEQKLSSLNLANASRDEIDKSLGLLPVNDKSGKIIAQTFEDRVKSFEADLEEKNKAAEEFVKRIR